MTMALPLTTYYTQSWGLELTAAQQHTTSAVIITHSPALCASCMKLSSFFTDCWNSGNNLQHREASQ